MLEGRLGDFTLSDILRLVAFTAKTGRLWMVDGDVEGRVDVVDGEVADASSNAARLQLARRLLGRDVLDEHTLAETLDGLDTLPTDLEVARSLVDQGALEREQAVDLAFEHIVDATFELLRWQEGAFRFEVEQPGDLSSPLDLALPVDDLLEEVARRLAEHRGLEEATGPLDGVVTIAPPEDQRGEVSLDRDAWALLSLIDGARTVADLAVLSGQGEHNTRRTLASLAEQGVIATGGASSLPRAQRLEQVYGALADLEAALHRKGAPPSTTEAPATAGHAAPPAATSTPGAGDRPAAPVTPAAVEATAPTSPEPPAQAAAPPPQTAPTPDPWPEHTPPAARASEPEAPAGWSQPEPPAAWHEPESPAARPEAEAPAARTETEPPAAWSEAEPTAAWSEPAAPTPPAPVQREPAGDDAPTATHAPVTSLHDRAPRPNLRIDPAVDEDLVHRVIDGVETL